MLLAAVLTLSVQVDVDLTPLLRRARAAEVRNLRCGIRVVGYRFVGTPGSHFRYGGERYILPASGWMELISDRGRNAAADSAGRELELDISPLDSFGFRPVLIPAR